MNTFKEVKSFSEHMISVYASELDQEDEEAVYTPVIQGAARARAASPTPTPATALSAIELLEKDRLWTTRKELVDDINHFQCTQNKNMKSVTEGSAGGKCLILRCDCAVTAQGKVKNDPLCHAKARANATHVTTTRANNATRTRSPRVRPRPASLGVSPIYT